MYKLLAFCNRNKIILPRLANVPFIRKVHSHYSTSSGWVFYVNTYGGDKFLEVFKDGKIDITDGWDGGDLMALPVVKEYYGV